MSETAQGRGFLEEYARRCRPVEPEASLAAIERMQAALRQGGAGERIDLLLEMADMAQTIVRMRAEIMSIKPPSGGPFDAMEELDSIVQTTESATSHILTAAEQVQEIAGRCARAVRWKRLRRARCEGDRDLHRLFLSGSHWPAHAEGDSAAALSGGSHQYGGQWGAN